MESDAIREYGGALFELASSEGTDAVILEQIRTIGPLFERGSDLVRLLASPNIPVAERVASAKRAFYGAEPYLKNFICLMTERGYARSIFGAFKKYESLYNEYHGIADAYVTSAVELTEAQKSSLASSLSSKTGKRVNLICRTDPSVLGGISVSIDGERFDGTISSKITQIRRKLSELSVN